MMMHYKLEACMHQEFLLLIPFLFKAARMKFLYIKNMQNKVI